MNTVTYGFHALKFSKLTLFLRFADCCLNLELRGKLTSSTPSSTPGTHLIEVSSTNFMVLVSFFTPWKHQKVKGFLTFSVGIKRDQCDEMSWHSEKNFEEINKVILEKVRGSALL